MLLYIISARSFSNKNLGRKISEVCKCFKDVLPTDVICGGDLKFSRYSPNRKVTPSRSISSTRISALCKDFITISLSEITDIIHCLYTYLHLSKSENNYNIVWERSSRLHFAGLLYARKKGIPYVLEWKDHLVNYKYSMFKWLADAIEKWKNRKADYIAVESKVLKNYLISQGIPEEKIYVTYNAVNPNEFRRSSSNSLHVREELNIAEHDIVVGYAGSYAFYHDSVRMFKAARILKEVGITNVKWIMIGEGKDKEKCELYAHEHGLIGNTVIMLPFQPKEKIPYYLSAMDITILPGSTDIICPIKVMEYMAAGTVTMVPDYECNREVITEDSGLLFEPFNAHSIAEQIRKIVDNQDLANQLSASARKVVEQNFTWDRTYGAVLRLILSQQSKM